MLLISDFIWVHCTHCLSVFSSCWTFWLFLVSQDPLVSLKEFDLSTSRSVFSISSLLYFIYWHSGNSSNMAFFVLYWRTAIVQAPLWLRLEKKDYSMTHISVWVCVCVFQVENSANQVQMSALLTAKLILSLPPAEKSRREVEASQKDMNVIYLFSQPVIFLKNVT